MTSTLVDIAPSAATTPNEHVLRDMIDAAALAPSAENTQPWRFAVEGDVLTVGLDAQNWLPSDIEGLLMLTGIGAAIESAAIAAREHDLAPEVEYFTGAPMRRTGGVQPVASIAARMAGFRDPLFPFLARRCTSRRMDCRPVEKDILNRIAVSISSFGGARIDWITSPAELRPISELVGIGNRIRFEHAPFHREFYENMRFSRAEAVATRDGLDVETLQLPLAVKKTLHWLRKWPRMHMANRLGFSRVVAGQAASEVRHSGAVGLLTIDESSMRGMLEGGRALQRLWLATVAEGLGFHPTASLPVFLTYAQRTGASPLPAQLQRHAVDMSERFCRMFPSMAGRALQMAFRVGYAKQPPVRSLRRRVQDLTYS